MNSFANTLSDSLLQKNFEQCSLDELKALSQEHSYASSIQFLYAQKLFQTESSEYEQQLQKTLLYYSNPILIKHLIESGRRATSANTSTPEETITKSDSIIVEETALVSAIIENEDLPETDEDINEETWENEDENLKPIPQFTFEPLDPSKAELSFTPYHTIDYFAAQGIKLGEENTTTDRFGDQLKSFTSWLKQMKRLTGAANQAAISANEEKEIEQMAEQSLQGENADTEAMAEVWVQQGRPQKAIDIYKKLSLQIPAKSAYFAAKIDHLKK